MTLDRFGLLALFLALCAVSFVIGLCLMPEAWACAHAKPKPIIHNVHGVHYVPNK